MATSNHAISSSVKYPYPVDVNVRDFVPVILSKQNYFVWRELMLRLLKAQGMVGFINGEVLAPLKKITVPNDDVNSPNGMKEMPNQDYQDWKRSDSLLQRWIIGTINEDVLSNVVCLKTAKDMWSKLVTLHQIKTEYPDETVHIKVTDFVPMKLSSENYSSWKTLMLRFIESQGLLGFINGEVTKPAFSDDNDEWRKSDEMLQRWIKETTNKDFHRELLPLKTSKDMWERLIIMHETNMVYPYPIEVNVGDFVPLKLSRSNYPTWRRLMLHLFENQGLLGFISPKDHNIIIPRSADSLAWKRTDGLLQSWIIRTINENFLPYVVGLETASNMWTKLESFFNLEVSPVQPKIDYPYPVEVNARDFVPIQLSSIENFTVWANLMLCLIESQGLLGFISGQVRAPLEWITIADENSSSTDRVQEVENPDYNAWKRTDKLLQRWIRGTINDEKVLSCVVMLETSREIWEKILEFFGCQNPLRSTETDEEMEEGTVEDPSSHYRQLHKAALKGDWETAKEFIKQKPDAVRAFVTRKNETALMVAVGLASVRGNHFVKSLLEFMSQEDVALFDDVHNTALHYAAIAGNTDAAKYLVDKNPNLPNYCDNSGQLPLYAAAAFGQKEMTRYLLDVTKDDIDPRPFEGQNGSLLIHNLILTGQYDIALLLIGKYRKLAWTEPFTILKTIAFCSSAFKSGAQLNWWQRLIYSLKQKLHYVIWKVALFVPKMKYIQEIKLKHKQALQLVKHLCNKSLELNYSKVQKIFQQSLMRAANSGIPEIVEENIEVFPELVYHKNEMGQTIFHVAILTRCEDVFNLIYQLRKEARNNVLQIYGSNEKCCLDLVVDLRKEQKLNLRASAAGVALQMQRELQWFKEVDKNSTELRTKERTTSGPVYTETHEELVKEGEKWMKDTATSCTIIAALVATVVFAAAITVPGGNDDQSGTPILFQDKAFIIIVTSDAIALFSSISSVVMFLSILTSRYSVNDFLFTLPNRLIIGLVTLFFSLISMMVAFGATLYLIFGDKVTWILFPVIALSCIPVALFAYSQFPLLLDMIMSTYGPGIFRQQSDRILC